MPAAASSSGTGKGGRAISASPTSSLHASPSLSHPSLPRIKLNIRSNSPASQASPSKRATASTNNKTYARQRSKASGQRSLYTLSDSDDSSSDLTPAEDDDEEDMDESMVTPRKGVHKGRSTPTQAHTQVASTSKSASGSATKKKNNASGNKLKAKIEGKKKSHPAGSVATSGPAGREKKRAVKLEDAERRRARDAKFDVDDNVFDGVTPNQSSSNIHGIASTSVTNDDASSFGDDESDRGHDPEENLGLPEGFAGQEIEDLAYGAGEFDLDQPMSNFWDETESSDGEDEELYINRLSDSELDQQSQSSVHESDSEDPETESDFSSSSDDGLDEFGFPVPSASLFPIGEEDGENASADPGLILMENWDGQFVLVQPRNERSRSRHRGDKGSRTNGSVSGSTTLSATDQQALIIDPDAADHEYDEDSEDSYWSGMSDEDDGGDTTDSMAEEDMPMLDSPALNELMEQQMAEAVLRMAVEAGDISELSLAPPVEAGPSIVITDPTGTDVHTPALSTTSSNGPAAGPSSSTLPQTPAAAAVAPHVPPAPVMGTFHPVTDDPAQHAVIDGSGSATKSPFTHRRRSRRARDAASMTSSKISREEKRRKTSITATDPFSPALTQRAFSVGAQKRARYSSIPGHPRYRAACLARDAEAFGDHDMEREDTPTDSDAFSLEDMLDASALLHEMEGDQPGINGADAEHLRHMIRFDRVGVSTYLRRNFGEDSSAATLQSPNGPGQGQSTGGVGIGALDHTLVGPMGLGGRMLISPVLGPTGPETGMQSERDSQRRTGRKKRRGTTGSVATPTKLGAGMAPLEI